MLARTIRTAFTIGVAITLPSACLFEDLELAPIKFENQSSEPVWVGFNPHAPGGFRVRESRWRLAEPGESVVLSEGGDCLTIGEFVVATEPEERAVIDSLSIGVGNRKVCPAYVWEWPGIRNPD